MALRCLAIQAGDQRNEWFGRIIELRSNLEF